MPKFSYFKQRIRGHTLFAYEWVRHELTSVRFGKESSVALPRTPSALFRCYLRIKLPQLDGGANNVAYTRQPGNAVIDDAKVRINNTTIDEHDGHFIMAFHQLTVPQSKMAGYLRAVGDRTELITPDTQIPEAYVVVPLCFWFTRETHTVLPMGAHQKSEVRFQFKFAPLSEIVIGYDDLTNKNLELDAELHTQFVHLDDEEHERMSAVPFDLLIEGVQKQEDSKQQGQVNKTELNVGMPVKGFIFHNQPVANEEAGRKFDYTIHDGSTPFNGSEMMSSALLKVYNQKYWEDSSVEYFQLLDPMHHWEGVPDIKGIHTMSFAEYMAKNAPSGMMNFTQLIQVNLIQQMDTSVVNAPYTTRVYACYYKECVVAEQTFTQSWAV